MSKNIKVVGGGSEEYFELVRVEDSEIGTIFQEYQVIEISEEEWDEYNKHLNEHHRWQDRIVELTGW
jgi:hypothetical protein